MQKLATHSRSPYAGGMKSPLVTIVTPSYNQKRYIAECVESVLAQTYPHWEQIVVDDGSTDGTPDIVDGYRDPRIRCIRLPHRGLAALGESYNTALGAARGELVAILEGDDLWPADKLAAQVPTFDDPGVLLSWGRGALVDDDGRPCGERVSVHTRRSAELFPSAELFRRLTRVNLLTPTVTVMVRRSVLDRAGGFRQAGSSLYVDLPTWLWIAATNSGYGCFLNQVLGHYRIHGQQTTRGHKHQMDAQHLQVVMEMERRLDPSTLDSLGWHAGVRSRALVSGDIVRGAAHLSGREFRAALSAFTRALSRADTLSDRARAALGMASAVSRVDLLGAAYSLRDRLRASSPATSPAAGRGAARPQRNAA